MAAKLDDISVTIEETDLPNFSLQFEFEIEEQNTPAAKKRFINTSEADRNKLFAESLNQGQTNKRKARTDV